MGPLGALMLLGSAYSTFKGASLLGGKDPRLSGPEPPPLPPGIDDATRTQIERDRKRRRGRAATVLTGPLGAGTPETAAKVLIGE